MSKWMQQLATHYRKIRRRYPQDTLMLVLDIDGTILDMRYLIHHVLTEFDRVHGTSFFRELKISAMTSHENHVDELLEKLKIPQDQRKSILDFWHERRWTSGALMECHKPFVGVMEIIRWFQMQPKVVVGLNSGRPEYLRADTLRSLNALGKKYNACFQDELLHLNPGRWEDNVSQSKVAGIRRFQEAGYRVFAMVDNEPSNLAAIAELDGCSEIMPLHAHTIFESQISQLPTCSVCGTDYLLTELACEDTLPEQIQFVWHGVNDRVNLRQFLASEVLWGEVDVRFDPGIGKIILHHDVLEADPDATAMELLELSDVLHRIKRFGKSIKFDIKESGASVDDVLVPIAAESFDQPKLWFNAEIDDIKEEGFRKIRTAFPSAILQCRVDFLVPQILNAPEDAKKELARLQGWGINRFSIEWNEAVLAEVVNRLEEWGLETNIYKVRDLECFLHAVLLQPTSITADFNFPKWHYYGRGSGEGGQYYEYSVEATSPTG